MAEYYPIGHDMAESLFDDALGQSCSSRDSVSLMFCGSGDARHLFSTLFVLSLKEMSTRKAVCKDIHITILDLKPAAIARTLIFFEMFVVYAVLKARHTPGAEDAPIVMAYLYAGHVVPAAVNSKLQSHISGLITGLETDDNLFDWLFLPEATRKAVVYVLKQWQKPIEANHYRAPTVRRVVKERMLGQRARSAVLLGELNDRETPQAFKNDRKAFDELAVLLPSKEFAERRDPQLVALMQQYEGGSNDAIKQLADHIDANWVTNLTLIDFDHAEARWNGDDPWHLTAGEDCRVPSIEADPLELARMLPITTKGSGVLEMIGSFFDVVSLAVVKLSGRLKIEALVGEMTDIMERLRWGCCDARTQALGNVNPRNFPRAYDRIHMSNIP